MGKKTTGRRGATNVAQRGDADEASARPARASALPGTAITDAMKTLQERKEDLAGAIDRARRALEKSRAAIERVPATDEDEDEDEDEDDAEDEDEDAPVEGDDEVGPMSQRKTRP